MTTEAISSRNRKRADEPKTSDIAPFTAAPGGNPITGSGSTTTNYTINLTEDHGMAVIAATVNQGPVPDAVFVALYPGPIPSNPDSGYMPGQWFWLENTSYSLPTTCTWGSGWYIGLSQKSYSNNDSSYTLICSAGPT